MQHWVSKIKHHHVQVEEMQHWVSKIKHHHVQVEDAKTQAIKMKRTMQHLVKDQIVSKNKLLNVLGKLETVTIQW
jgi:hypothetical protein